MPRRATKTSWKKGQSGNPRGSGPPGRESLAHLVQERLGDGQKLVDFWLGMMTNQAPGFVGEARPQDGQRASEVLAEWGYNKPKPPLVTGDGDGEGLEVVVQVLGKAEAKPEGGQ